MNRQTIALSGSLVGGAVIFGSIWLLGVSQNDRLPNGITIGSVPVGGLAREMASDRLTEKIANFDMVTVHIDGTDHSLKLMDFGLQLDGKATIDSLLASSGRNQFGRGWQRLRGFFGNVTLPVTLQIDQAVFAARHTAFLEEVNQPERDAQIVFRNNGWVVIPSENGARLDPERFDQELLRQVSFLRPSALELTRQLVLPRVTTEQARALIPKAETLTTVPITLTYPDGPIELQSETLASWIEILATSGAEETPVTLRLNESKIRSYVKTLAVSLNRDPVNARVAFKDGTVTITETSIDGQKLDEEQTIRLLVKTFDSNEVGKRSITLPLATLAPDVSTTTVANLGLKELVGKATTSYGGSPDNRKHNIQNGARFLTGKLVKPGEEFSVIGTLGAVDDTTGYLPELVIKENRTTPEFGGGLCQVSTTLFRAALNAGLKITERKNHSYRVSYYERGVGPGLDATIYQPSPDLKFLNDTPGWILIQGGVDQSKEEITFELYGTKDGRKSEISKPTISDVTNPPDPIYAETADLPRGQTKQIEKPHQGAKTVVTYKVYRGDEVIIDQTFRSTYKAWPARYLVGTAEPTPAPTETNSSSEPAL